MTGQHLRVQDLDVVFDIRTAPFIPKKKLYAVDGVSFEIGPGETLGLVGESGSGKSTTGLAVLRLIEPTSGKITLGDDDISAMTKRQLRAMRRQAQMVFQDPYSSLNPSMRVMEILEEPLKLHDPMDKAARRQRVVESLEMVGLRGGLAERYPHEFSGGQRQRIAIARAIISRPKLVVCDEPVSALDVSTQSQIIRLLRDLQSELGTSYLFIGHDLAVVRLMSTRTAVMYLGQLVETGPSADVYDRPTHPYTAALNSAIPIPDPEIQRTRKRIVLGGDQPSPLDPPSGCRFRTRCPFVMDICAHEKPPEFALANGGFSRCHLHESGPKLQGASVMELIEGQQDVPVAVR